MDFLRRWWWVLLLVILVGLLAWCRPWRQGGQTSEESSGTDPKAQTNLEIEMYGGFAYVRPPEDNTLEVAYLRSWEEQPAAGVAAAPGDLCKVEQMGVDLMVYSGTIVEPAVPPDTKTFQVAGTVVTFPALASSGKPLIAKRSARPTAPPFGPDDHKDPAQWHDLKWVPKINAEHGNSLNPDWRNIVDGRMVVRGGTFTALHPSDVVAEASIFEFKSKSGPPAFKQAVTDRTMYKADVAAEQIVIDFSKAIPYLRPGTAAGSEPETIKRVIVRPVKPGQPVPIEIDWSTRDGSLGRPEAWF